MKIFLVFLLVFSLFSCQNQQETTTNTQTGADITSENTIHNSLTENQKVTFAPNLTFARNEIKNIISHNEKEVIFASLDSGLYTKKSSEDIWQHYHFESNNHTDFQQFSYIDFAYNGTSFNDIAQIKSFFQTNPAIDYKSILIFNEFWSEEEIIKIFEIFEKHSSATEFVIIEGMTENFLKNPLIAEKYQKHRENFGKIFPENISVNIEKGNLITENKQNTAENIIKTNLIYSEKYSYEDNPIHKRSFYRNFENLEDLEEFLQKMKNQKKVDFFFIGDKNNMYSDEIIEKITKILGKYKNYSENLKIFDLKKHHFENENILKNLAEIEITNLTFEIEHNSPFELREKFYKYLLNGKTIKTISFSTFGIGNPDIFCRFVDENEKNQRIIQKNNVPYLFCLNKFYGEISEEDTKVEKMRDEYAK